MSQMFPDTYLEHHGIKGQRWGIRRFQPYPKGHKGGKEVGEAAKAGKKQEHKMTKEEARQYYETQKERALKSGTAQDVLRFKGDLTNRQMQEVVDRINLEQKLASYAAPPKRKSNKEKMDDLMKDVKTINEWTKIGTDTYNTFAALYNATDKGRAKPLRFVQTPGGGKGKK